MKNSWAVNAKASIAIFINMYRRRHYSVKDQNQVPSMASIFIFPFPNGYRRPKYEYNLSQKKSQDKPEIFNYPVYTNLVFFWFFDYN